MALLFIFPELCVCVCVCVGGGSRRIKAMGTGWLYNKTTKIPPPPNPAPDMHFFSDSQRPAFSFLRTQRRDADVAAKDKENWQIEK